MRDQQNPHTNPPALPLGWGNQGQTGYVHGLQSSERWTDGASDSRQICDELNPAHMWRVSVFASQWVRLDLKYGTSRGVQLTGLMAPLVLYVPGQLNIFAAPTKTDTGIYVDAYAYCTVAAVNSAGAAQIRKKVGGAQAFPDHALRFYALDACTVQIGSAGPAVALTLGQSVPLIAGSSLTGGDGYLEFEL